MAPGPDAIIKLVLTILFIPILVFIAGVFNMLVGPILDDVLDVQLMADLGWGTPQDVAVLFGALALIGLGLVVVLWYILSPIRDDVRQEQQGGF